MVKKRRWLWAQWLEIRWWRWYLKRKPVSAYLEAKKAYWQRFLAQWDLNLQPEQRVLDAGCGPAGIFITLHQQQVTALDPLLNQYQALEHFSEDWYPQAHFHSGALEAFKTEKPFSLVFCINVINHVQDVPLALKKMYEALEPGGTLALSVDAHRVPWLKPIFQAIPGDALHPHQYSGKDYQDFLREAGFQLVRTRKLKSGYIFDYLGFQAIKPINDD